MKEVIIAAFKALPALFMPVLILGGILSGMFTPTEAAGVSCVYALLVGVFVYRKLNFNNSLDVLLKAGLESGMVMLLIASRSPLPGSSRGPDPPTGDRVDLHHNHVALDDPAALQHLFNHHRDSHRDGPRSGHRDPRAGAHCRPRRD